MVMSDVYIVYVLFFPFLGELNNAVMTIWPSPLMTPPLAVQAMSVNLYLMLFHILIYFWPQTSSCPYVPTATKNENVKMLFKTFPKMHLTLIWLLHTLVILWEKCYQISPKNAQQITLAVRLIGPFEQNCSSKVFCVFLHFAFDWVFAVEKK